MYLIIKDVQGQNASNALYLGSRLPLDFDFILFSLVIDPFKILFVSPSIFCFLQQLYSLKQKLVDLMLCNPEKKKITSSLNLRLTYPIGYLRRLKEKMKLKELARCLALNSLPPYYLVVLNPWDKERTQSSDLRPKVQLWHRLGYRVSSQSSLSSFDF